MADSETISARVEHHADAILRAYDIHREVPCPRCHETCGWCSDYRFMHGKLRLPGTRRKCTIAAYHPDEVCPLCGGSKRVWMTVTYSASYRAGEVGNA